MWFVITCYNYLFEVSRKHFTSARYLVERLSVCIFSSKTFVNTCFRKALGGNSCLSGLLGWDLSLPWSPGRNCFEFRTKSDHFYWLTKCLMGLEPGVRFPFFHHSESSDWPVWVALWGLTQTSLCEGKIWRVYTRLCVVTDPCVNSHGDVVPREKWPCLRGGAKTSKLLCDWLCIFLWVCVGAREVLREWFTHCVSDPGSLSVSSLFCSA